MTGARPPVTDAEINAYVDDELDAARRAAVEAHLAEDSDAAARVAAFRAQNAALHECYDDVLDEPVPGRLTAAARSAPRGRGFAPIAWRAAAAAAMLAVGAAGGWTLRGATGEGGDAYRAITEYAAHAHVVYAPEVRHPVEVPAAEEAHLVRWLSKRLGATIRAPRLGPLGYRLVGGRLLPDVSGPAAQFMYEDETGRRITLYVRTSRDAEPTAFRFAEEHGVRLFYWVDGPLAYAIVGEIERDALTRLARAVYEELNRPRAE